MCAWPFISSPRKPIGSFVHTRRARDRDQSGDIAPNNERNGNRLVGVPPPIAGSTRCEGFAAKPLWFRGLAAVLLAGRCLRGRAGLVHWGPRLACLIAQFLVATAERAFVLVEELGELLHHGAAKLFGIDDGDGAAVVAGDIVADADGDELDRRIG